MLLKQYNLSGNNPTCLLLTVNVNKLTSHASECRTNKPSVFNISVSTQRSMLIPLRHALKSLLIYSVTMLLTVTITYLNT